MEHVQRFEENMFAKIGKPAEQGQLSRQKIGILFIIVFTIVALTSLLSTRQNPYIHGIKQKIAQMQQQSVPAFRQYLPPIQGLQEDTGSREWDSVAESIIQESSCSPYHHFMFLKTHKCASSTVQNIFLRYGYQHNLTFALGNGHILGFPTKFNYNMLNLNLLNSSGVADIFTLHSRLNIPEHQKAIYSDAKWITIVRDPVQQFPSLFAYYELKKFYRMDLES
ncbi:unnamed protein product, partial [Meganyctiphanes norvegica]